MTQAMWICALNAGEGGEAQLSYPRGLTAEARDDLIEWLEFVAAFLKKRRAAGPASLTEGTRFVTPRKHGPPDPNCLRCEGTGSPLDNDTDWCGCMRLTEPSGDQP